MRSLLVISILVCTGFFFTNCAKDKAPNIIFDPTCSDTVSFSQDIMPLITDNCISCHDDGNSTGYTFTSHGSVSTDANHMLNAMRNDGVQLMPQGGPALPDSLIKMFNCWIQNGKPNN